MSNQSDPLMTFLRDFPVKKGCGNEATLCGMGTKRGSWSIPDEQYPKFLDILSDYLKKGRALGFVEQPRLNQPKPLLIDLDFKFKPEQTLERLITPQHYSKFVSWVAKGLGAFFDTERYQQIRFFVSLRPQPYPEKGKPVKDGIHIQSPDIALTNDKQQALRSWLLENNAIADSFSGIGYINDVDDIYDASMVRKQGWFLYGESKPNIHPYELHSILAYVPEKTDLEQQDIGEFTKRQLMEILSVRYNVEDDDNEVLESSKDMYDKYLKPRPPAPLAPTVPQQTVQSEQTVATGAYIPGDYDDEEIEISKQIALNCLSPKRAEAYKTWMETGWCLYNIDHSEEMFNTFVEFSKKSPKANANDWGKTKAAWFRGFSKNTAGAKLTMKSLHFWAREDNLEEYTKIVEEDHIRYAQYRVNDTHHHAARLLARMYKGRYCASVESRKTEWYSYDEKIHTWKHTNQGMDLRDKLSSEVADLIVRARQRLKKKAWDDHCSQDPPAAQAAESTGDENWFKKWSMTIEGERFQVLTKLENHLYSSDFKNCVMKEAAEMFCEEDFTNLLNMNPYLFVCKNGVIDLYNEVIGADGVKKVRVVFRPGKPEDYMSFLAGRNYPDSEAIEYHPYRADDPTQKELMGFLTKIFPQQDMLAYVIRLMASCLEGTNKEQCYYTFIGIGGNGKSKLVDLMRYTLGDYCSSLAATALTRKRPDSGAANPDIIAIKNKRFIYLQEPDDREPLNTSRMKQFSGEDVVEARGLFEEQQRFRISGKLHMMCNRLPPIHAMDRGTWRRIRVILFGSKFVDSTDPELAAGKANVFARDNDLDSKLRTWREAWLSLLVHVYETQYLVNGLSPIPDIVMMESNRYKESFDQYGKFKSERIVDFRDPRQGLSETGDEEASIKDIQLAYTNWVRQNEGALVGKKLSKQEMQNRLDEDFGTLDAGVYKRIRVFFDDEGKADFVKERTV